MKEGQIKSSSTATDSSPLRFNEACGRRRVGQIEMTVAVRRQTTVEERRFHAAFDLLAAELVRREIDSCEGKNNEGE